MTARSRLALILVALLGAVACHGNANAVKKRITNQDKRLSVVSINSFPTSIGPVVVGEIRNISSQPVGDVRVTISLKDKAGGTIGQQQLGFTLLRVIPPGQRSAFSVPFPGTKRTVGTVSATVQADPQVVLQLVPVKIASQGADTLGTDYEVTGTVANSSDQPVHFANVVATFYDKSGSVVGAAQDVTSNAALAPGQSTAFRIILQEEAFLVADYKLAAEAQVVAQNH